jgi:sugar (pentulose or hexulose) kinase
MNLYLGIDLGTSGVRTAVIDADGNVVSSASVAMESPRLVNDRSCQDANLWWNAVANCLIDQRGKLEELGHSMQGISALSVDGTSGTLLLVDQDLNPLTHGYMYDSANFRDEAIEIEKHAPKDSIARGEGSALARLLFLQKEPDADRARHAMHQADWIAAKLMHLGGCSDETNVLKMGFDVRSRQWPDWISRCGVHSHLLPNVQPVGGTFGTVDSKVGKQFGLAGGTRVVAGTTDSNAAFLASGASQVGEGVTSLGTTLAIKLLSDQPVSDPSRGIYSHRIKDMWLPGGASNTGGGVLLDHFSVQEMRELESQIDPMNATGLDYYPLSRPGERFPIYNPKLPPRLMPRSKSDAEFFQGMLEGIAEVERIGYAALAELGAPILKRVFTAGGGASNRAWTQIRARTLSVPISEALSNDAAVGTARIAAQLL